MFRWLPGIVACGSLQAQPASLDLSFVADTAGTIFTMAVQSDQRILIGGGFTSVGGVPCARIARLNPDGSLDPSFDVGSGPDGTVKSLAIAPDGRILIGGYFTSVNGVARKWVARLDKDGQVDTNFVGEIPVLADVFGYLSPRSPSVEVLAVQSRGHVILAGNGGLLLRLRPDGSLDRDDILPIYGSEGTVGNAPYPYFLSLSVIRRDKIVCAMNDGWIRHFNSNGTIDRSVPTPEHRTFPVAFGIECKFLEQLDGRLLVSGAVYGPGVTSGVFRLMVDSSFDTSFHPPAALSGIFGAMALQNDGKILIAGSFTNLGGISRPGLARLLPDGDLDLDFDPGAGTASSRVRALALQQDCRILVAGDFTNVNGVARIHLARLNNDIPGPPVITVAPTNQTVATGNDAYFVVGIPCAPYDFQWKHNGTNLPGATNAILQLHRVSPESNAGDYTVTISNASGSLTSVVATLTVLDSHSGGWPDIRFAPGDGADGRVRALARQSDGRLVVGGYFQGVNGVVRPGLARLFADGRVDESFNVGTGLTGNATAHLETILSQEDGKILIGGKFTVFNGVTRSGVVRLNADGSLDPTFDAGSGPAGSQAIVYALVRQRDGKVLVGGSFTVFNGVSRKGIVRLNSNGTVDTGFTNTTGQGVIDPVYSLGLQSNGRVLVAGGSSDSDYNVVRLTASGAIDALFNPGLVVYALLVQEDDSFVVTGWSRSASFRPVVRYLSYGALDSSFMAPFINYGGQVRALARDECGRLLIAGMFQPTNAPTLQLSALLDVDGSFVPNFDAGPADASAYAIAGTPDGGAFVGGDFTSAHGVDSRGIIRLHAPPPSPVVAASPMDTTIMAGSPVTLTVAFSNCLLPGIQWFMNGAPIPGATNLALSFDSATLPLSGSYFVIGNNSAGSVTSAVATLTVLRTPISPGSLDTDFHTGAGTDARVLALAAQSDGKLLVGGEFTNVQGVAHRCIARLKSDGSLDSGFDAGSVYEFNGSPAVRAIVPAPNGQLLIVGRFSGIGGINKNGMARLNTDGTADPAFDPASLGGVSDGSVLELDPDGKIVVGEVYAGARRFLFNGTRDFSFSFVPGVYGPVNALIRLPDGRYFVAGDFTPRGNFVIRRVAILQANGEPDPGFNLGTGPDGTVFAAGLRPDGRLLIAGSFTTYSGVSRRNIACVGLDGVLDTNFDAGLGADGPVMALSIQSNGTIYAGGNFTTFNGVPRRQLVRLSADGSVDETFVPNFVGTGAVLALLSDGLGRVWAGGSFTNYGGLSRRGVVRIHGNTITGSPVRDHAAFFFDVMTASGWAYHLERSESLPASQWTEVTSIQGDGTPRRLTDPNPISLRGFYRVRVE